MRHVLQRPGPSRGLARHRPRAANRNRADEARARDTDIVLAILGISLIGALCLFVAIGSGLGS